jgi:hypothetical protein
MSKIPNPSRGFIEKIVPSFRKLFLLPESYFYPQLHWKAHFPFWNPEPSQNSFTGCGDTKWKTSITWGNQLDDSGRQQAIASARRAAVDEILPTSR